MSPYARIAQLIREHATDGERDELLDYHGFNDEMTGAALAFICSDSGEDADGDGIDELRRLAISLGWTWAHVYPFTVVGDDADGGTALAVIAGYLDVPWLANALWSERVYGETVHVAAGEAVTRRRVNAVAARITDWLTGNGERYPASFDPDTDESTRQDQFLHDPGGWLAHAAICDGDD